MPQLPRSDGDPTGNDADLSLLAISLRARAAHTAGKHFPFLGCHDVAPFGENQDIPFFDAGRKGVGWNEYHVEVETIFQQADRAPVAESALWVFPVGLEARGPG